MNNDLLDWMKKPLIKEKDGIVLDANELFLNFTHFNKNDLCEKNITDVLDKLFRCTEKISITDEEIETALFTKTFDVRFVKIKKHKIRNSTGFDNDINLYIFDEIENSRLDNKLLFVDNLMTDNKIGISIYTANDLKLIKANQKFFDYMREPYNTKETIYGKSAYEFLPNFMKYIAHEALSNIYNNKPIYFSELQNHILGIDNYWDNTITPISENGEVKYIMSIAENVTERVLSRKHIQRKNKQLESIIESVDDIISIIDKDGKYLKQNSLGIKLLGENADVSVGFSLNLGKYYDLAGNPIPLDDLCFTKLLKGEKVKYQKLKYVYNGNEYYSSCTAIPIFDEKKQFEMGVIITHDITELVTNNKLISNQKKELEVIFDNISDALLITDNKGNYIKKNTSFYNQATKKQCITTFNKVGESITMGQKYYNDNDEELSIEDIPFYKISKGEIVNHQRVIIKNQYNKVYLEVSAVPIFDELDNFQYGIIVVHDVTHIVEKNNRIKQQQQLIIKTEQEKLQAIENSLAMKDEFISLISHEFKTPLNVIYSAIQLIEGIYSNEISDKVRALIKTIKQNTFRQLRLVNNLLDITRINSGRFKLNIKNIDIVSLTRQISQSVSLYSEQKNVKLLFRCNLKSKIIATDDEKLERIILNLLSNALKFTSTNGTVILNIDENKENDTMIIEVSDTGIGIPADKQELIFERFGQVDSNLSRHAEGTGIGLSLVKKLVDILNGKIELESELGVGSTFRIVLPINQHIEEDQNEAFFDGKSRLVNALNVEFSDIYL